MKIVLINQEHAMFGGPGGAERSVQSIAEYFVSAGHQVTFIAMTRRSYMRDMTESGIHSIRDINGVRTILVGKRTNIPTHADLILPIILAEAPDVIHTNVFHRAPQLWQNISRLGIPILHSLREYKLLCDRNMFDGTQDCGDQCLTCTSTSEYATDQSQHVDGVIGISHFTLQRHLRRGMFKHAAVQRVIPNSYKPRLQPEKKIFAPGGKPKIGFLGRMHASKGINLIIDVFSRIDPAKVALVMAGDLQDEQIATRIETLGATHDAKYVGFVDPPGFFRDIDVLVAPSIWHEPFGRITIEAFAHGVPVIATLRGGLPDIVEDGKTGWLFDPDEPDQLVKILDEISLLTIEKLESMSSNAVNASKNYLPSIVGEMYLDAYREIIAAKQSSTPVIVNRMRKLYEADAKKSDIYRNFRSARTARERRPISVLVVAGEFPKLSETFVLNHVTGLLDLGMDVKVLYTRPGSPEEIPSDFMRYKLQDRIVSLLPTGLDEASSRSISRVGRNVGSKMGLALANLPVDDPKVSATLEEARENLLSLERTFLDLHGSQVLARLAPEVDVIHCHFGHRPKTIFKYLDYAGVRAPVVCSFHGIDMSAHVKSQGPSLYDDIKQRLHRALPISNFFRDKLINLGFEPKDVQVHRVGVDCSRFQYSDRRRFDGETLRLISVGRCVYKKGFEFAIRGVAAALQRRPDLDVVYTLIGDGSEMPKLSALVEQFNLHDAVKLVGAQPHSKVTTLMAESHAMLAPSITGPDGDMEGIPTVTMEAMATGLPVISTIHSGIPEAVVDGYTGLLSQEGDPESIADHILTLYDNPELGSRFGRQGRVHVLTEFNIRRQNEKIAELYERIAFGGID
jgi:colanic acid/amylovoran biosynthesis glycosyltransferase